MSTIENLEEDLRYYSCVGNEEGVKKLIDMNVDVNSRNSMNGWTALHWAVHRNHPNIVQLLLANGADPRITNDNEEIPGYFSGNAAVNEMLGASGNLKKRVAQLPIIPSYLRYPTFLKHNCEEWKLRREENITDDCKNKNATNEVILKVRIADAEDPDFIEVELNKKDLNVNKLIDVCCKELNFHRENVLKIRKLPNTVIRKDRDVERLQDYQEIEIVLSADQ